jgi:hypothetical protein
VTEPRDQQRDQQDPLRDRLRAGDPASSLPPADPHRVARLLEDVMSTELTTENRATGTRNRGPLTWLVAAAAVLIIAGVGIFAFVGHESDRVGPPTAHGGQTVTELAPPAASAYAAKCMVPNAQLLSQQTVAVDATVTAITADEVTLKANRWYAGNETNLVRVQAAPAALQQLVGATDFKQGGRYLVSATHGVVTVCGFSGAYSPRLAGLYQQAFAG